MGTRIQPDLNPSLCIALCSDASPPHNRDPLTNEAAHPTRAMHLLRRNWKADRHISQMRAPSPRAQKAPERHEANLCLPSVS